MKTTFRVLLAATGLAVVSLVGSVSGQTIIVQDSFTLNGGTRISGGSLNGSSPEVAVSGGTWGVGTGSMLFSSSGTVGIGTIASSDARIGIATPSSGSVTVSADLTFGAPKASGGADWMSVGFLNRVTAVNGTSWINTEGVLWVLLSQNGGWQLFVGNSLVKNGTVSGFSTASTYTLGLTYDVSAGTASVFIKSGATTTSLVTSQSVSVTASSIVATGFRIHAADTTTAGTSQVDNFLSTTTAAIPEPSTAALLLGALAGGVAMIRRRTRS